MAVSQPGPGPRRGRRRRTRPGIQASAPALTTPADLQRRFVQFRRWHCPLTLDLPTGVLSTLKAGTVQPPWKEPRRQIARRLRPVGARFVPAPACPRPYLQLLHQTRIPVHGYDTASVPSNLPPREGGLCASPGSFTIPPHAPLRRRARLPRLDGRHSHLRGGEDVGAQTTVRRTIGGAGEQARELMPLAQCPVEGCPVGGRIPRIPPSMFNCSLRCSRDLAASPLVLVQFFGTGSFPKVLATAASTCTLLARFTLEASPDLHSYNSRKSLYTGMTVDPVHFRLFAPNGRTCESSHKGHGVPPYGSSHLTAGSPALTDRCGLTRARRRER